MPRTIDQQHFRNEVINSAVLAVVHFKSEWSGTCQILAPVFEEMAKYYEGSAKFFVLDIEGDKLLENEFGIHEVPTILFFRKGEVIDYSVGLISKNGLIGKIENALTKEG